MTITFRRAIRENIGLVIGVVGPSGGGKTLSAFRLAAGIAGSKPFAVIDTEAGRGKHYADRFVFDHADLKPPFRPDAYAEAIKAADDAGYPVIVVDSCSHEHAGEGGLLDWHEEELDRMAGNDWKKRETCAMAAWVRPKMSHKAWVQRLLQVRAHLILAFRAEQKVEMMRGANGKMEIVPKRIASGFSDWIPVAEKNILYELTASFLLTPDRPGIPQPIKLQDQVRHLFPTTHPIDENAGKQLAAWAAGKEPARESERQAPQETLKRESTLPPSEEAEPAQAERAALLTKCQATARYLGMKKGDWRTLWREHCGEATETHVDPSALTALLDALTKQCPPGAVIPS
jgi:hypothetical protein